MNGNPIQTVLLDGAAHRNGGGNPVILLSVRPNAAQDDRTADWLMATLIGSLLLYPKAEVRVIANDRLGAGVDRLHAAVTKYGFNRARVTVAYDRDGKVSS